MTKLTHCLLTALAVVEDADADCYCLLFFVAAADVVNRRQLPGT